MFASLGSISGSKATAHFSNAFGSAGLTPKGMTRGDKVLEIGAAGGMPVAAGLNNDTLPAINKEIIKAIISPEN